MHIESNSIIDRFKSAREYAEYMEKHGYAQGFYYLPLGINPRTDDFKMEYYRREWYRCQTIKTLFNKIEALEKMIEEKNPERSVANTINQGTES